MPTLIHRLSRFAETEPKAPTQAYKVGSEWKTLTSEEVLSRIHALGLFFEDLGLKSGEIVAIFSPNCKEWVQTELGAHLLGCPTAGIYPNSVEKDFRYILEHTQARVLAVQNQKMFEKMKDVALPESVTAILVFEGEADFHPKAIAFETALARGENLKKGKRISTYLKKLDPHAGLFLIYTSGTTGNPKGVLLSHDNLVFTSDAVIEHLGIRKGGRLISFLPLSHIAEKLQCLGIGLSLRYCTYFASAFDKVSQELPEVQPTALLSVPRLWEKMMEGVLQKVNKGTGAKKKLALWALETGRKYSEAKYGESGVSLPLLAQYLAADRLVLSKVRAALGLGEAHTCASGAAALPAAVSRWFRTIGIEIVEDYGQSESTGVICLTPRGKDCAGTVGKPPRAIECKIADDGEILTQGRSVFQGYFKDEEATRAALQNGWLHTGDLGEWTDQGMLKIRGRKKEIMKTSGGKMIAPLAIEERVKASPHVAQVCMVGDGRKYFTALITLSETTGAELRARADAHDGRVVKDPGFLAEVKAHMEWVNSELANFEKIKQFTVLVNDFSIEGGEMTPTLKMKRAVVEAKYRDLIDAMYPGGGV
jgi:long-chain acyl-CoA synthetase